MRFITVPHIDSEPDEKRVLMRIMVYNIVFWFENHIHSNRTTVIVNTGSSKTALLIDMPIEAFDRIIMELNNE